MITNFCEVISRSCFGANNRSDVKTVPSGNKATQANLLRIAVVLRGKFKKCAGIRRNLGFARASLNRIGALPHRKMRLVMKLSLIYSSGELIPVTEKKVSTTIIVLLAAWLGLNVAFVAMRFYVTADRGSRAKPDIIGYPRLVN